MVVQSSVAIGLQHPSPPGPWRVSSAEGSSRQPIVGVVIVVDLAPSASRRLPVMLLDHLHRPAARIRRLIGSAAGEDSSRLTRVKLCSRAYQTLVEPGVGVCFEGDAGA